MKLIYLFILLPCFAFANLQNIIQKYKQSSGVIMDFKKNTYLDLLKKTKNSAGKIFIRKSFFLLKVEDTLKTKFLFDGKDLLYITKYTKKPLKIILNKTTNNQIILSILFQSDLLLKQFKIVSSRVKGRAKIVLLKPLDINSDIDFFSVKTEKNKILKVWFNWKNPKNTEEYSFSNIQFNKNILPDVFKKTQ